ncbi:efflux RND transporter permease subunit [Panacagrimonas sp.]|uniref:efflux RND transporter permease subunit n=1 Tax=Panacagrimonas sp. TaxID=2480088 RepID=UPI003B5272D6
MYALRFRIARWFIRNRSFSWAAFVLVTIFFAVGLKDVELRTIFSDLLPKDDPFVQVFKDHPNFGNPLTVTVMLKRTDGNIYNAETLDKVWQLTRDIDLSPGVDHDQILSIATEKARYAEATPFGIDMRPLMGDHVPKTPEEIADFRMRVDKSPGSRDFLISRDHSATLINATFIEAKLDYGEAFAFVQEMVKKYDDDNHDIYVAGQPTLTGWVYFYQEQMRYIFGLTLGAMVLLLALYMRNVVGVVTPIIVSTTAAVWGFGLVGWLKSPIEPLLMIVPLLLVARSFSHCVQFTERYYEIYAHVKDRTKAAEITMGVMMPPSVLGIFTDMAGVFLIAIAPIPAMERFAFFAGMWCIWLIPTGIVLCSLLLSVLPAPANADELVGDHGEAKGFQKKFQELLAFVGSLSHGKRARITSPVVIILAIASIYTAQQIKIGNPTEGSNLLWDDSEFNESVRMINRNFPGVNTLEIVLESKEPMGEDRAAKLADTYLTAQRIQDIMEKDTGAHPPRATLSFGDYLGEGQRLFAGGNPKWLPVDGTDEMVSAAAGVAMAGSSPKAFSHVVDFELQHSTVSMWYPDNKQETVDYALAAARKAVEEVGVDHDAFTVRLGTGTIALQQAVNIVVDRFHYAIIGALSLVIWIACSIAYRSIIAGFLLLIPVNLANFVLTAMIHLMGVGLDINTLMVAAIGVGVGIDYGIYLLSRICEEYHAQDGDWGRAIDQSLMTTGKAIMFTATIMFIGIMPWYFLSGLKFMADMGLLLMMVMLINMVLALVFLPLLVWWFKPKFVKRKDLFVGEGVDLSIFEDDKPEDGRLIPAK